MVARPMPGNPWRRWRAWDAATPSFARWPLLSAAVLIRRRFAAGGACPLAGAGGGLACHHGLQARPISRAFCQARLQVRCGVRVCGASGWRQPRQSPEDAARRARCRALAELPAQCGAGETWLLAQHADDQAET